jgi:hypothetical protein
MRNGHKPQSIVLVLLKSSIQLSAAGFRRERQRNERGPRRLLPFQGGSDARAIIDASYLWASGEVAPFAVELW